MRPGIRLAALAGALVLASCVGRTTDSPAPIDIQTPGAWTSLAPMPSARQEVAVAELPFYAEKFTAAGFDVRSFRSLDDLVRLPTFRKQDMLAWQTQRKSHRLGIERRIDRRVGETFTVSSGTIGTTFLTVNQRWRRVQGKSSARVPAALFEVRCYAM